MLIQDYLDICDPVLTFDRFMGGIELEKYLKCIPKHYTGRFRYDPVSMLKTVMKKLTCHALSIFITAGKACQKKMKKE